MPLFLKGEDISWHETAPKVHIIVRLPCQASQKNVSFITSTRYLRISCPPYIWECVLCGEIETEKSTARISGAVISFELLKKEEVLWGSLKHALSGDKAFCREQLQKALEEMEMKAKEKSDTAATAKNEARRAAVRRQMHLDELERKRVEEMKENERERIAQEIQQWQNENDEKTIEISNDFCSEDVDIPQPRRSGAISVSFTPRVFPTAARESQEQEEMQWLEHQAAARKCIELDIADIPAEQRNPAWLKEKGNDFFKKKDYYSAVNAYGLAIRMCPKDYELYMCRADCHLMVRNLHKAIEDSSKVLELLQMSSSQHFPLKAKAHVCRGKAFRELKLYVEGLMDFEAALKLEPQNERLKEETEQIRALVESGAA